MKEIPAGIIFVFTILVSLFASTTALLSNLSNADSNLNEDGRLGFIDLAAKYGFPNAESRDVVTEDGYILRLYRIPGDVTQPLLLTHGNTADSNCWIIRGNTSLAIILARKGYDVWAINSRGTTQSRRHLYLNPDTQEAQFYNYTFFEQGYYDLPATIDMILNVTQQTQLLAVGHSVGTMNFYVLGSSRPEYNAKIKAFISLAPISFLQHLRGLVTIGSGLGVLLNAVGVTVGVNEVAGNMQAGAAVFNSTCLGPQGYLICVDGIVFPLFGFDQPGFEEPFLRTFFGHFPEGSSRKLFDHLDQVIHRNKFARYDYGTDRNMIEYGTPEPPLFNLSQATMKYAIFVGQEDYLASVPDAERLRDSLPNVVHYQVMPYEKFNHFDFVWGRYMTDNLYPYLLPVIDQYI